MKHNLNQKQVIEISKLCREITNSVEAMTKIDFTIDNIEFIRSFKDNAHSILDSLGRVKDDMDDSEFAEEVK